MRHTKDKTGKNKRSFFIFAIVFEIMFYYGNTLNAKEKSKLKQSTFSIEFIVFMLLL